MVSPVLLSFSKNMFVGVKEDLQTTGVLVLN